MAVKHKVKKIRGIKVVTEIKNKEGRPLVPRTAVFESAVKYDRNRAKTQLRREIGQDG